MDRDILLSIKNIKKTYHSNGKITKALKGVSFDLYEGEIMGLLGVNGAGKTTLSSIIASLHPPTSGDILYKGTSIYDDIYNYRFVMGYCPQKPNLNPLLTIKQNLMFAGRFYGLDEQTVTERVNKLMKQYELHKYADSFISDLSGGYKQRVSIARTLIAKPKLVIFDEPTVGLDPHIRHNLWEFIKELKKNGISVLLTTHYLDEAEELSDRVCVLDKGKVKVIDTPQNLKKKFNQDRLEDVFITLIKEQTQE